MTVTTNTLEKLSKLHTLNILVAGDVMLDEFHWCTVSRISPEAPVPICKVDRTELVPGGAANVAHNIKTLGATPLLLGVIGGDSTGNKLIQQLHKAKISADNILKDPERPTTLKSRIIAHQQQVARVDREDTSHLSEALESQFLYKLKLFPNILNGIVISDYLKGTITPRLLQALIKLGRSLHIPVIIDPKGDDYKKYHHASILTPNFSEFEQAIHKKITSEEELTQEGLALIKKLDLDGLIITRSEKGATVLHKEGQRFDIPTKAKEVYDITGAGDTVISVIAIAMSAGIDLETATYLANEAAGIVVGKVGTATLTFDELKHAITSAA